MDGNELLMAIKEKADSAMLTVIETAEMLRVSQGTIYRLLKEGELVGMKVGKRTWRIPVKNLHSYLLSQTLKTKEEGDN